MLSGHTSLSGVVSYLIGIINTIIPLLVGIAVLLFLYSGLRYILKAADSKGKGPERDALMWGIIALFVLVSVWGILRLMCTTLFGNPQCGATSSSRTIGPI